MNRRIFLMLLTAICAVMMLSGCGNPEKLAVEPEEISESQSIDAALHEPVPFSELYAASIPLRISLPIQEGQIIPWQLDAEVIIPENLQRADILNAKQMQTVVHGDWQNLCEYFLTDEERASAAKRDDERHKLTFESTEYWKSLSIFDGGFTYSSPLVTRDPNARYSTFSYSEKTDADRCSHSFTQAQDMARLALKIVAPSFDYTLWRAGAFSSQGEPEEDGYYRFFYSQIVNGIPIANPSEQGGKYERLWVPEYAGVNISVGNRGITELRIEALEVTGIAQSVESILSLENALRLYRLFVEEGRFVADKYHSGMNVLNHYLTSVSATLDQVNLCYIVSLEKQNEFFLIPCWMFSCGSVSRRGFGIGFHAVTGEVVWFNGTGL